MHRHVLLAAAAITAFIWAAPGYGQSIASKPARTGFKQGYPTLTGYLTEIDVSGNGPASAQLEFVIDPKNGSPATAFVVLAGTMPQVFSSMPTLLTLAYLRNLKIGVTYIPVSGQTPEVVGITLADLP